MVDLFGAVIRRDREACRMPGCFPPGQSLSLPSHIQMIISLTCPVTQATPQAKSHSKDHSQHTVSDVAFTVAVPSEIRCESQSVESSFFGFLDDVLHQSTVLPDIKLKDFWATVTATAQFVMCKQILYKPLAQCTVNACRNLESTTIFLDIHI